MRPDSLKGRNPHYFNLKKRAERIEIEKRRLYRASSLDLARLAMLNQELAAIELKLERTARVSREAPNGQVEQGVSFKADVKKMIDESHAVISSARSGKADLQATARESRNLIALSRTFLSDQSV